MSNKISVKERNSEIEGLRGVALLFIVFYHVIDRYQQIYCGTSIRIMDFWGTFGVTIFLMISSYFIVNVELNDKISLLEGVQIFGWKVVRLWPTYFISILIIFGVTRLYELPGRTVDLKSFIANIFFINRFLRLSYVDGAHWYLGVLLSVYLIIIIFHCIGVQNNPVAYFIWLFIELAVDKVLSTGEMYPLGGPFVGCICIGIAIRHIQVIVKNLKYKDSIYWMWILLWICSLGCTFVSRGIICTVELMVVAPIIWLCGEHKIKILESKVLIFLGAISYPLYLIHQNISFSIQNVIIEIKGEYSIIWSFLTIILVFIIGVFLYYIFEKPVQEKIDKMKRKKKFVF